MKNEYFKMIVQKTVAGKSILVAVVPDDFICDGLPLIFEVQAVKMAPTIYTGTYPTIKIIPETIKDRSDSLKGLGIGGILTEEEWYNVPKEEKDLFGIALYTGKEENGD